MKNTVSSVDIKTATLRLADGQRVPITNWLRGREEVAGPSHATTVVGGPCADGKWYATVLEEEDFE